MSYRRSLMLFIGWRTPISNDDQIDSLELIDSS